MTLNQTPLSSPNLIQIPVDFHYLDTSRVNGIYSEIEPELIETQRTVAASKKSAGSAEVTAGPASLKGEKSSEKQETSKFERSESSAERKCVQLMNYTLQNGSAHYYRTIREFYAEQLGIQAITKAAKEYDPNRYKPIPLLSDRPIQLSYVERQERPIKISEVIQAFRGDLKSFAVVDGVLYNQVFR